MKAVPGIRFYPSSISVDSDGWAPIFLHGTIQEKRSDFDFIFEPLYPLWSNFVFLDDSGLIRIFDSDLTQEQEDELYRRLASYVIQADEDQYGNTRKLMSGSVLTEFGKYVYEFEGAGFCMLEPGVTIEQAARIGNEVWSRMSLRELPEGVICLIQNWDGVFWQIFSTDLRYLEILQAAHGGSELVPAYWVELSEDFPNPRGSSPEEVGMKRVEPGAAPNGGPAASVDNSNAPGGPSPVS
ncbi:MAG: hypothetical protein J0M24_26935 [Verrucomicrobia bacterium]|nr:hypothetical protein [Verrucomicrobiota bacterium]